MLTLGVVLFFITRASRGEEVEGPSFELGGELAFDADEVDDIDDNILVVRSKKRNTECFTGSEMYELTRVFCDQLCRRHESGRQDVSRQSGRGDDSRTEKEYCNGPWYCSRTEICETFSKLDPNEDSRSEKSCMVVRSCANHSHCFPTPEDASNMNIVYQDVEPNDVLKSGFTSYFGGQRFTTTCCSNRANYRPGIDAPCNSAPSSLVSARRVLLLTPLLVVVVWLFTY